MAEAPVPPTTLHLTTDVSGDAPERIAFSGNLEQLQRLADMVRTTQHETDPDTHGSHRRHPLNLIEMGRIFWQFVVFGIFALLLGMALGWVPAPQIVLPTPTSWTAPATPVEAATPVKKAKSTGPSTATQLKAIGDQLDALQQDVDKLKTPPQAEQAPPAEPPAP